MPDRPWGSHYPNGSLVLSHVEGKLQLVVVTRHGGDYFHHFVPVEIVAEKTTKDHDNLVGHPDTELVGYWVGPAVGHLNTTQMMSLAAGIVVPKLKFSRTVEELLHITSESRLRPSRRASV